MAGLDGIQLLQPWAWESALRENKGGIHSFTQPFSLQRGKSLNCLLINTLAVETCTNMGLLGGQSERVRLPPCSEQPLLPRGLLDMKTTEMGFTGRGPVQGAAAGDLSWHLSCREQQQAPNTQQKC